MTSWIFKGLVLFWFLSPSKNQTHLYFKTQSDSGLDYVKIGSWHNGTLNINRLEFDNDAEGGVYSFYDDDDDDDILFYDDQ